MGLSGRIGGGSAKVYTYDRFNRLMQYNDGATEATYTYSADNLRQSKTVNGEITNFVWNGQNLASETTDDVTTIYNYDMTGVLGSKKDGEAEIRYHKDPHGNVLATEKNNALTGEYTYDAFGNQLTTAELDNPFRYCGEYFDKESGNIYLRNRYYSTATGRFINEDPIKDGLNWYSYCGGEPVMHFDPSGLILILQGTGDEVSYIWAKIKDLSHDNLVLTQLKDDNGNLTNRYKVTINKKNDGACKNGTELIRRIVKSGRAVTVKNSYKNSFNEQECTVLFNPHADPDILTVDSNSGNITTTKRPNFIGLAHELIHAERYIRGVYLHGTTDYQYVREIKKTTFGRIPVSHPIYNTEFNIKKEDLAAIGLKYNTYGDITENMIRAEHGYPMRGAYS